MTDTRTDELTTAAGATIRTPDQEGNSIRAAVVRELLAQWSTAQQRANELEQQLRESCAHHYENDQHYDHGDRPHGLASWAELARVNSRRARAEARTEEAREVASLRAEAISRVRALCEAVDPQFTGHTSPLVTTRLNGSSTEAKP